jgi:phage terminase large subunit-like protein
MSKKNFKLHTWQKRQLQKFRSTLGTKRPNHIVIAPRHVGKTTMIAAYTLWYALLYDNKCICLLSYKKDAAIEILRIIREMYTYLPKSLQLNAKVWTKECVQFANNTRITICNCQTSSSIKGRAFDLIVADDAANISDKDFNNFMTSVFPTQACKLDSQMIFITTPKDKNSKFHELYEYAITKRDHCSFNVTNIIM